MSKFTKKLIFIFLLAQTLVSCKYDFAFWPRKYSIEERSPSFTDLGTNSSNKFAVLVMGDTHFGRNGWVYSRRYEEDFYNRFTEIVTDYYNKGYSFDFSLNVGDCSDSGAVSEFVQYNTFEDKISEIITSICGGSKRKVYNILGNHDLFNNGWSNWKDYCYPNTSTYYFKTQGSGCSLSWYFLDSGSGTLGKQQLNNFKNLIKDDSNQKIILSHYPIAAKNCDLYTLQDTVEVAQLLQIYGQNNVKLGMEGHFHKGGSNNYYSNNDEFLFHEEVLPGFVDHKGFGVLTVDLTGSTPELNLQIYSY